MKRLLSFVFFAIAFSLTTKAAPKMPHFDLEMSGVEWLHVLESQGRFNRISGPTGALSPVLELGKRNLDWLRFINSHRTTKISLTDPKTTKGIPIESPKEYSEKTVLQSYSEVIVQMPASMKKVLVDNDPLTPDHGITDSDYIFWGRKVDVIYQTAARWLTMQPWLTYLENNKQRDVRGYYFLSKEKDLTANLANYSSLPAGLKENYGNWLTANCMNGGSLEIACRSRLASAESSDTIQQFYNQNAAAAQANWDSFFKIPTGVKFSSLVWSAANPDVATIPFLDPVDKDQRDYLWQNIEDEWKWLTWKLKLDFNSTASPQVRVHWRPGITPHVAGLGSGEVFMDSNAPLTE